jgi:hypothetical protein
MERLTMSPFLARFYQFDDPASLTTSSLFFLKSLRRHVQFDDYFLLAYFLKKRLLSLLA